MCSSKLYGIPYAPSCADFCHAYFSSTGPDGGALDEADMLAEGLPPGNMPLCNQGDQLAPAQLVASLTLLLQKALGQVQSQGLLVLRPKELGPLNVRLHTV